MRVRSQEELPVSRGFDWPIVAAQVEHAQLFLHSRRAIGKL